MCDVDGDVVPERGITLDAVYGIASRMWREHAAIHAHFTLLCRCGYQNSATHLSSALKRVVYTAIKLNFSISLAEHLPFMSSAIDPMFQIGLNISKLADIGDQRLVDLSANPTGRWGGRFCSKTYRSPAYLGDNLSAPEARHTKLSNLAAYSLLVSCKL